MLLKRLAFCFAFLLPSLSFAAVNIWTAASASTSNTAGNWSLGHVPQSSDALQIGTGAGATNSNITFDAGCTVASIDFTGFTGTITFNTSQTFTVSGAGGFWTFAATNGTVTWNGTAQTTTTNTSGTVSITSAGKSFGNSFAVNGTGGTTKLLDTFTGNAFSVALGTFDSNNQTMNIVSFAETAGGAKTTTLGTSTINISSTACWATNGGTQTWTSNSATVNCTSATTVAITTVNGMNYNGISFVVANAATTTTFTTGGSATISNISITGPAGTGGNLVINGTLNTTTATINGNSNLNRYLIQSATLGTAAALNCTSTFTTQYLDVIDVNATTAKNISAITGNSSNCGGTNSGWTFTTPASEYWVADTANASATNSWASTSNGVAGTGHTPMCQDTIVFDSHSFSTTGKIATIDLIRTGGVDGSLATNSAKFTGTTGQNYNGSMDLSGFATTNGSNTYAFIGRSNYTLKHGSNVTFSTVTINAFGGTYKPQDSTFTMSNSLTVTAGTFDDNGKNITTIAVTASGSVTRAITMGATTWTLTRATSAAVWTVSGSNVTITCSASNIITLTGVGAGAFRTFAGGGNTYGTLTYTVAGSTTGLQLTGATNNSFVAINFSDSSNARILQFTSGTTTTITTTFNVSGTSGKKMTVSAITAASAATLAYSGSGVVNVDYDTFTDITGSAASIWYVGVNSNSGGGNTNINLFNAWFGAISESLTVVE